MPHLVAMKFVIQKRPSGVWGEGDCVTASTASVLGKELEEIPELHANACMERGESQTAEVLKVMREHGYEPDFHYNKEAFGEPLDMSTIDTSGLGVVLGHARVKIKDIEWGVGHATVHLNGELFWDPWPYGAIGSAHPYAIIYPTKNGQRIYPDNDFSPLKLRRVWDREYQRPRRRRWGTMFTDWGDE